MKGLVFDLSIPKYVVARGLGGLYPKLHYGAGSCLSLRELPRPTLPGMRGGAGERLRAHRQRLPGGRADARLPARAAEGPDCSVLVTHTFPLARYQEAIEANLARARFQSVKTVFDLTR
jgi:hypothetical protein